MINWSSEDATEEGDSGTISINPKSLDCTCK